MVSYVSHAKSRVMWRLVAPLWMNRFRLCYQDGEQNRHRWFHYDFALCGGGASSNGKRVSHADPEIWRVSKPSPDPIYPAYVVVDSDHVGETLRVVAVTKPKSPPDQLEDLLRRLLANMATRFRSQLRFWRC